MGGEVSKVNASPSRIPPKFLYRLDEIRKKRCINRGTSKLSDHVIGYESLRKEESVYKDMKKVEAEKERVAKLVEAIVEEDEEGEHGDVEDEDNDMNYKDDERVIKRHVEEDNCPGSPSFRVYFTNNYVEDKKNEVNIGKKDVFKDTTLIAATTPTVPMAANIQPLTKEPVVKEGPKKERKRKSFRRALPKNLLNVRSCCSAAHSSPDRTHLLPRKAPA